MPKIVNLFRDKVYTFYKPREVFDNEREIIYSLLRKFDLNVSSIDFVDANMHNDIFKIHTENGNFYLKLSLESEPGFFKESKILEKSKMPFAPTCLGYGKIDNFLNLNYSLLSSLEMQSLRESGVAEAFASTLSIPYFLNTLSYLNYSSIEKYTILDYLKFYLNFDILKVPDTQTSWFEENPQIKNLAKKQVVVIQEILKEKLKHYDFSKKDFCHGNLNQSTILCHGEILSCINFEKAYIGDFLFELLNLKYELFYNQNYENQIIYHFSSVSKSKLNLNKINEYREFACYFNLLKICVDYLQEVFILKSQREDKILNIAIKFSKNYENFHSLPDFEKSFKPIAELFIESVI